MATTTKAKAASSSAASTGNARRKKLVPTAPERTANIGKGRKRLAKAFPRPLDKIIRKPQLVREKFSMPALEYDQLLELKSRLAELGVPAKKSEIVRAGLLQLAALEDEGLKAVLARLSIGV